MNGSCVRFCQEGVYLQIISLQTLHIQGANG